MVHRAAAVPSRRWLSAVVVGALVAMTAACDAPAAGRSLHAQAHRTTPAPAPADSAGPDLPSFPTAQTTGWAHTGVTLTRSPGVTVTKDGTVLDGLDVSGNVEIKANNVTVQRTRITAGGFWPVKVDGGFTGFTLLDSQIVGVQEGSNRCEAGVTGSSMTLVRNDISNCADGIQLGTDVTIRDNFIHDLWLGTDAQGKRVVSTHNDGIQVFTGSNITIAHNRIDIGHHQNSAVFLKADFGPIAHVRIDNNYLDGGAYTVFGADTAKGTVTDVTLSANTFGTHSLFGPLVTSYWTGPTKLEGNVSADGQPIPKPTAG